ncbi:hypothetical protein C8F04DRAFT_1233620 [Mycena alexandri]|uniref:F-box domain-containing protein n=1 Tax=Mycena alexandri TaxID=1745969 RepID=A0AAD6SX69_9AGAR|nr:hypothetical protein C8F04DRAFT_1233620 [Mycena alexandri]
MSFSIGSSAIASTGPVNFKNQVKALIEATEANIARLTTQIHELTCLRAKECSVVARLRTLIAPIGRLPTELLVEVFKIVVETPIFNSQASLVLPVRKSLYSADSSAALGKVLCLSQVSPHWRQIIHGTPRLWAEGVIAVPLNRDIKERDNALFTRSTPCPISVSLTHSANEDTESSNATARFVMSTAQRWKNLNIDLPSLSDFDDFPLEIFDTLERLHVNNLSKQTNPIVMFHSSPRLQKFSFTTALSRPSKISCSRALSEAVTRATLRYVKSALVWGWAGRSGSGSVPTVPASSEVRAETWDTPTCTHSGKLDAEMQMCWVGGRREDVKEARRPRGSSLPSFGDGLDVPARAQFRPFRPAQKCVQRLGTPQRELKARPKSDTRDNPTESF